MQEGQAQSAALNRLTSHMLQTPARQARQHAEEPRRREDVLQPGSVLVAALLLQDGSSVLCALASSVLTQAALDYKSLLSANYS